MVIAVIFTDRWCAWCRKPYGKPDLGWCSDACLDAHVTGTDNRIVWSRDPKTRKLNAHNFSQFPSKGE